ncbi:homogentisate 1,2-dioxygenase, putative [Paecilomyces variotii No. 5]|uniref:homogentisate 1,2-dioxygenase n=1 Tax=Byssochlamys spectabilis (strain No. 5 / NBRC 109023) TaxID=1356009 RepID=V5GCH6_BYSSN|nr:homogentisate 1,2-dioxygenase, putative [Paecilomyces variotii No. 5]
MSPILLKAEPPLGETRSATYGYTRAPSEGDPYRYQVGFGNRFVSEAVPDTIPRDGRNLPQRANYDLYIEQLNGTTFVTCRKDMFNVWFHRIRPSCAHKALKPLEYKHDIVSVFSSQNEGVSFVPFNNEWGPLEIPLESKPTNFWQGIKTILGHGDPTLKEGVAVHQYAANLSMDKEAFVNHDGDYLFVPQQGRLDIQTELGRMMVLPGELFVIPAGLRFKVSLPDGPSRGYIQEIFGSHFELPDLGPIGSNGLALPQDFEIPVASYDLDTSSWEIITKLAGKLYHYEQAHTPFDVVGWHGNYVPYKYEIEKLLALSSSKDQLDPSAYTILTAKSKIPGVSITDFCAFTPKWVNSLNSWRPPYYHRTMGAEVMGMVRGEYGGSAKTLEPGALTCDNAYVPHGETYDAWKKHAFVDLEPTLLGAGVLSITKFALERHNQIKPMREELWDNMHGHFLDHTATINAKLTAAARKTPLPNARMERSKGEKPQYLEGR